MNAVVAAMAAAVPVGVGALVTRAQRWIGWLLIADGVSFWLIFGAPGLPGRAGLVVAQLGSGAWVFLFAWVAFIAYLLPDGQPGSRRWSWWLRVGAGGIALLVIGSAGDAQGFRADHHGAEPPLSWLPEPASGFLGVLGLLATVSFLLGAVVAVRWRLQRAAGEDRLRLLWLVWGALTVPLGLVAAWAGHFGLHDNTVLDDMALAFAAIGLPVAIGIAVLRHRLFDIQVVLARTLVYAGLSVVVTALYVGLLWAAGKAFGDRAIGGGVAVVVVAVSSTPLYTVLRRRIERWVYGYRSDPAEALRRLGADVDSVDPLRLVETITASVAHALKVETVLVQEPGAVVELTGPSVRTPLLHRGESMGDLVVLVPPGRVMSPSDRALMEDLARQAAATVRAAHLATELQASRSRIVTSREEERKRLRRDLHDGLGPALAAIVLKVNAAQSREDQRERNAILADIAGEAKAAIAEVRRLVDDLRPPAIDEVGLVGAIRQRAEMLSTSTQSFAVIGPEKSPPLPAAVEVAAFRIASEAISNVAKHSSARRCTVTVAVEDRLMLTVSDDGVGGARPTGKGVGWTSMTERAAELGGTCTIVNGAEGGLIVRAVLPLTRDLAPEVIA